MLALNSTNLDWNVHKHLGGGAAVIASAMLQRRGNYSGPDFYLEYYRRASNLSAVKLRMSALRLRPTNSQITNHERFMKYSKIEL